MAIQQGGAPVAPRAAAGKGSYPVLDFAKLLGQNAAGGTSGAGGNPATDGAHPPVDHNAIRRVVGRMPPPPLTPMQQAQQLVSREITPLQNAITGSYTGMANAGGNAIRQATDAYANQLAAEHDQLTQPYTQAEQAAAASQDAFANRLTGAGTAASDELAQRLGSIGEPGAVNPVASALAGKATAAGNAVYGTGNATLDQLLGEGAAAEGYASKLPGVARTAGLQQLGQFESGLTANEGKDMLALEEKAPALAQSAYGTITSANSKQASITAANQRAAATVGERKREYDVTQAGKTLDRNIKTVGVLVKQTDANGNLTQGARTQIAGLLGMPVDAISATNPDLAAKAISGRIAQQRADTSAQALGERVQHDKVVENQGQQKITLATAKANASASAAAGRLAVSQQHEKAYEQHLKQGGTLTPNELNNLVGSYHDGKNANVRVPTVNAAGKQVTNSSGVPQWHTETQVKGQLTYDQAISRLVSLGKPRAAAVKAVNGVYEPGDGGRPYTRAQATQVAAAGAAAAYKAHVPYKKALVSALKDGTLPRDVVEAALQKAYYSTPYSPVAGSAHYGG